MYEEEMRVWRVQERIICNQGMSVVKLSEFCVDV